MLKKIGDLYKAIYNRFRQQINYAIFGLFTTIVNMVVYHFLILVPIFSFEIRTVLFGKERVIGGYLVVNAIAFVASVIFSYFMNRNFVFGNKVHGATAVVKQFFSFLITRILSFLCEEAALYLMVDKLGLNSIASKWIVSILVVFINYGFGKLVVFRAPKDTAADQT